MKNRNYRELFLVLVSIFLSVTGVFAQALSESYPNDARSTTRTVGCGDGWDTTFTTNGVDGTVQVVESDAAGNIYIGGTFTTVNGVAAANIAKWDGTTWSALGSGIGLFGSVRAIAISGNDVYVGGSFASAGGSPAKNVAKWNGSSWSALGAGLGGGTHVVDSIVPFGGNIYIGGSFNTNDGSPANGFVRWDGNAYFAVTGIVGQVSTLAVNGGFLYAGGNIAPEASGGSSIGIMKWDGTTWTTLGTAANTNVSDIAFSGSDVYAVGVIRLGASSASTARFNGTTWTLMQTFSGFLTSVAVAAGEVYVGGQFTSGLNNIARWTGSAWVGVSGGLTGESNNSPQIHGMAVVGTSLVVGGTFTTAGTAGARNIATLTNGTTWSGFNGTGIDAPAAAIAVSGNDVYVAGSFTTAGPVVANKIAKWNNVANTWSALGTGVSASGGSVSAIAVAGDKVYAGGSFTSIGGVSANRVAVWNGSTWAPLGTGISGGNGRVSFIIVRGDDVYVGGDFTTAGGVAANRVAKWNGTTWSGLNSTHIPTTLSGMTFMGNDLYVSTGTTTIANPAYFSKYDGTTWTLLGGDLGDRGVSSIAASASDVYVTGGFTTINGITVNRIAKWNGTSWSALGNGLPPTNVSSGSAARITVSGNDVIATGDFTVASGAPADRIAKWNGNAWTGFGTGLNVAGNEVKAAGGDIFVGGSFTTAGCNASPYFARWRQNVWTGATSTDWHTSSNWGGGTVPPANAGISIGSNNISISSSDVTVSNLIVTGGRTVTVATGRTLTVTGNLDLSNGLLAGPGTVVVNGDVSLNGGNITGIAGITINGNLYLGGGTIAGTGTVTVTSCRPGAVSGGSATSFVNSPLTRCVDPAGTYRFPVGSNGLYAPVDISNITGTGNLTVEPKTGAYSEAAAGLPANRLQRWWNVASTGVTQAELTLTYSDSDIVGTEPRYKIFRVSGGTAQLLTTTIYPTLNRATSTSVTAFAAFTLADGPSLPQILQGRVRAASLKGAFGVLVSITDQGGNTRYSMTNPFGYYRFPDTLTWENYTVRVQSKRYTFSNNTQTLLFPENSADVNFTATNH